MSDSFKIDKILEDVFYRMVPERRPQPLTLNPEAVFEESTGNSIFESFYFGDQSPQRLLPFEWSFAEPTPPTATTTPMTFNLAKIINETDMTITARLNFGGHQQNAFQMTAAQALDHLNENLTALRRHLFYQPLQGLQSVMYYVAALQRVSDAFENNVNAFCYELRRRPGLPPQIYQSESFVFEHLHALLLLLARTNSRAIEITAESQKMLQQCADKNYIDSDEEDLEQTEIANIWKKRSEYFITCVEILSAMHTICRLALDEQQQKKKFVYLFSPKNLSSSEAPLDRVVAREDESARTRRLLCQFIENGLGGLSEIVARIHYCLAKRNEMCYHDYAERLERSPDETLLEKLAPVLKSIVDQYSMAKKCAARFSKESQFYKYTRFMRNYWFCRLHLLVSQIEASPFLKDLESIDDLTLENAKKALVRIKYTVETNKRFCDEWPFMSSELDKNASRQFKLLKEQMSALYGQLDKEIYQKRGIVPTEEFSSLAQITPHTYRQIDSLLHANIQAVFEDGHQAALSHSLQLAETISQLYHSQTVEIPPAPIFSPIAQKQSQESVVNADDQAEQEDESDAFVAATTTTDDGDDSIQSTPFLKLSNECKLELLEERLCWIESILACYDEETGEFSLGGESTRDFLVIQENHVTRLLKMKKK